MRALPGDVLLIIDGAYAEYVMHDDYDSGLSLVENNNNVVITRTFSKIYGLSASTSGLGLLSRGPSLTSCNGFARPLTSTALPCPRPLLR